MNIHCCLCHNVIIGSGNDPFPLNAEIDLRCCTLCYLTKVVPAKLAEINVEDSRHESAF